MTNTSNTQQNNEPRKTGVHHTGRLVIFAAIFGAIIFGSINMLSSALFRSARIDLTSQHLYSLSNGTKMLLGTINEPLRFRFFLSSQMTKEAPQLAAFAQRVRSMLDAYAAASNGKIVLEVIDPRPFSEDEDRAVALGVSQYRASSGDRVFFGLAATNSTDGKANIPTFSPEREQFLEYDLTRMVAELGNRGKPVVAVLDGMGLFGNPQMRMPQAQSLVQMAQFFDIKGIGSETEELPENTRVLMIVHPQGLSDKALYMIDQWVVKGGATMVFVDPWAEGQIGPGGRPPPDASSDMPKLFKAWGIAFDPKLAVADINYAFRAERMINDRPVTMINLPWMALRGEALNRNEAILAQLQAIVMTTVGSFTSVKEGVSIRPLISASKDGGTIEADKVRDRNADLREQVNQIKKTDKPPVMAGRMTGKLESAFTEKPKESKAKGEHVAKGTVDANVILVGDADMLTDRTWVQRREVLGTQVAQAFANNGDFVNNAIENMAGGPALTDLRGRGVSWRPFETIQKMEAEASKQHSAKEKELMTRLKETEQKISQLASASAGADKPGDKPGAARPANEVLSAQQVQAVEKFKTDLLATREELRQVQYALRSDVDGLKRWITALNVAGIPLLAGAIALLFALMRRNRPLPKKRSEDTVPANKPAQS